ncbi:MAG: tetratricopeptide repeat protein [Paracoccaceae bacterium]|nr:tetratricopeptide repeat protein [Paracoccaceae bacterium]
MRHPILLSLCLGSALFLVACQDTTPEEEALQAVNVIDESDLNDVMLTAADPQEAVAYFARTLAENPERIDLKRGLAMSLVRAKDNDQAVKAWQDVTQHPEATNEDKVRYADALIRNNNWPEAESVLNSVPPTYETFDRYRLEAMIADSNKDWKKADSFYEIASGMTTRPSGVLNNWGYSKLTRGEYASAERLFGDALKYNSNLYTAKNNLVLARGAQRKYDLPIVPMTQIERAQLLYTLALTAIKQGDIVIGKTLLQQAIDTHPQHFEAAVRSLNALETSIGG